MATLAWLALGVLVVLAILALGLHLNRAKAAAQLAVRLAEVYRTRGEFETAVALYDVPHRLYQNVEGAAEGRALAREKDTRPLLDADVLAATAEQLARDREGLEALLAARGAPVSLPASGSVGVGDALAGHGVDVHRGR